MSPQEDSFWRVIVIFYKGLEHFLSIGLFIHFFALCVTILLVFFGELLSKNVTHGEMEAMSVTYLMLYSQQLCKLFHYARTIADNAEDMFLNGESMFVKLFLG